ncbi:class I SAM-dependent methyltransferase [Nocardioides sp. cx-173]|uniref:class I SAM-dependent methyltransferase n=1 Tax=Nocardioides sp. cx-173 TaxID=2898796 RepID=UPI001E3FE191|nr:class I SAM-dependent methyltransferase [Nocardioides sp. cx-173]MCD4525530.1 class I SAM-dependent methyltransferase [Nocardioides sp. cx-173]UGB42674.1 class I SAM-dependent methyltransferase [Nocardioides sp. cx-173]
MTDLTSPDAVRRQYAAEGNLQTRSSVWHPDADGRDPSQVALDAVVEAAPARMLEVGCGTGGFAARVRDALPELDLVAIDASERFVELTSARGVTAHVADAQALPFEDSSFDLVAALWMLYHVPDLHRGLAEVRRVLRPGGTFVAVTNGDQHVAELRRAVGRPPMVTHFSSENGEAALGRHFSDVRREDLRPRAVFPDHAAAVAYLASADEPSQRDLPWFDGPREYAGQVTVFVCR